jgi:hypothetical protein
MSIEYIRPSFKTRHKARSLENCSLKEKPRLVQNSLVLLRSFVGRLTKIDFTFIEGILEGWVSN